MLTHNLSFIISNQISATVRGTICLSYSNCLAYAVFDFSIFTSNRIQLQPQNIKDCTDKDDNFNRQKMYNNATALPLQALFSSLH